MKKSLLFLLGQLCLCLSLTVTALAQDQTQKPVSGTSNGIGTISGTLLDSLTGKPIEFATVALLQGGSTQAINGTLTDSGGRFAFTGLASGNYDVTFSFIGYDTKTIRQLSITAGNPEVATGPVVLAPVSTQLKEVNVQTLRPAITQEADRMVVSVEGTAMAAGSTATTCWQSLRVCLLTRMATSS